MGKTKQTPRRYVSASQRKPRPGSVVLRSGAMYQRHIDLLLRAVPFQRVVKEITQAYKQDLRMKGTAVLALKRATEEYLLQVFAQTSVNCRAVLTAEELALIVRL